MKLEELVPPLELCKKIPEGEFADSALVWWGACVYPRIKPGGGMHMDEIFHKRDAIPAPTLQEILEDLTEFELWENNIAYVSMALRFTDDPPAIAALKVWLKLKGPEA